MRRLRTILVEGFKTFHRPHVIDLADGMTAVVGPNGCGKSNLVDAVAWAVGSRSWTALRGATMMDVIFHGAEDLAACERAIVRLVFDNADRALGLDVEEVEIAREIARGGGGRVFLNGTEARLKDVQNLLAGTGLVGGFSIVRQGTVDEIILASPEELGRWLEESAGIAKYRGQTKEALDRLEKVRAHLAEAQERLAALARERRRLRDRAAQARSRQGLQERLAGLREAIARADRQIIEAEIRDFNEAVSELRSQDSYLAGERQQLLVRRARLEEELAGSPASSADDPQPADAPMTPEEVDGKVGAIRSVAADLDRTARDLESQGANLWPRSREALGRAAEELRLLIRPNSPAGKAAQPTVKQSILAAVRDVGNAVEDLDSQRGAIADTIMEHEKALARADERLKALPPRAAEDPEPGDGFDLERCQAEISELERKIARIGPVDETAAAREEEVLREIETVKAAVQDLRETQSTLLRFLDEVDRCAAIIFRDTLGRVGERFQRHCETLFGGGRARIRLVQAEDAPEEREATPDLSDERKAPGLEIRVKLPGKAEASLSLLSGGERSLTGIALVLALATGDAGDGAAQGQLLLLDEVDAALDDANAVRFAALLPELARTHQILCVTHNSRTAREASRLIGVTTGPQRGTSIVVEVDSDEAAECSRTRTLSAKPGLE